MSLFGSKSFMRIVLWLDKEVNNILNPYVEADD
jgi:hypothetical protein